MKKQYRDFLFYCLFLFLLFLCKFAEVFVLFVFCIVLKTLWKYTFVTVVILFSHYSKKRLVMHACARSAKQKYELIYITNEAVGRVGYYQLISGKSEKNNCFSKFSSNSLDFFVWKLLKSWQFLYRRRRENIFSDLQNFSTRNSPSVFPYLVKLNDNGSYHGLKEPIRKLAGKSLSWAKNLLYIYIL